MLDLCNASWSSCRRKLLFPPSKEPSEKESGNVHADLMLCDDSGEADLTEYYDFKHADVTESCVPEQSVQGRIAAPKTWWFTKLQLNALVIGVLLYSYRIPFVALPSPCFIKNNKCALDNADFVAKAIDELLRNRCISEVSSRLYCCNPLYVVVGRKLRLILNVSRSVNPFVQKFKFKYEGLPTLAVMFRENYGFVTFDIEPGYDHLDINTNFWKFLGFSWCLFQFYLLVYRHLVICSQECSGPLSHVGHLSAFLQLYTLTMAFLLEDPFPM